MLLFKRIYKACVCANYSVTSESTFPENEHDEMVDAYYRRALGDDETIQIEARRGWYSWGF